MLSSRERKIPRDDPAFSQRMLENHLSQEHDWASRRQAVIEQQVAWIAGQLPAGARILDLGCGPGFYTRLLAERGFCCTGVDFHRRRSPGPASRLRRPGLILPITSRTFATTRRKHRLISS